MERVIHQGVLLHDRGGIKIGKNVVIGSYARIFSHSYEQTGNGELVKLQPTTIGDGSHIGSHEIIMGGTTIAPGAVVGRYPAFKV